MFIRHLTVMGMGDGLRLKLLTAHLVFPLKSRLITLMQECVWHRKEREAKFSSGHLQKDVQK